MTYSRSNNSRIKHLPKGVFNRSVTKCPLMKNYKKKNDQSPESTQTLAVKILKGKFSVS